MRIGLSIVGTDKVDNVPPKYYEKKEFSPSVLLNIADEVASVLDFGMMTRDVIKGYHWIRVYFQRGALDLKADDWEARED